MNIRSVIRDGIIAGVINIFVVLLGLPGLVGGIVRGWLHLSSPTLGGWALLLIVALWGGVTAARTVECKSWRQALLTGLLAGALQGVLLALPTFVTSSLVSAGTDLRQWLAQLSVEASQLLTLGLSPVAGSVVMFVLLTAAGVAGTFLAYALVSYHWRESLGGRWDAAWAKLSHAPLVQRFVQYEHSRQVLYGLGILLLLGAPLVLGQYWNYTLGTVGIYVMLGLGLNIVVGLAGLLDLGYVAFYAIGAYTIALLTAPEPHAIMMNFWPALPVGIVFAAVSGVLLGIPVLRMRGDYLAIVTLGFGEIIRILSKSDALTSLTRGPGGVPAIGGPSLFGLNLNNEFYFMYFIVLGIVVLVLMTYRLQRSRVGRAWMAMREDEDVAEAMGIYTLRYKLLAFAIGAAFAGLGGVIFASRNKFTGPEDFTLLVSINVLCLVIIGGMGSIPGVVMGALVLKGLPEILRELDDYRMLVFGALLVVMMIVRPEGLWPSARRRMELHEQNEQPDRGGDTPMGDRPTGEALAGDCYQRRAGS
jgi:ABC-type branched-subunit amino acid transport system permease subunit